MLSHAVNHVDTCEKAIPASGCRRSVAGKEWHGHMRSALAGHGLTPLCRPTNEHFKFGDGRVEVARVAWTYPVGLYGDHGTIDIAEVSSACPPLLSVEAMEELGIVLNFLNKAVSIENAKVYDQPMERTSSGRPVIPLTKYTEGETIPGEFLIYYADPVYPVENEDTKFMKRCARKRLARIANSLAEVFESSNNDRVTCEADRDRRRILEIFTWTQRVTLIAREYGWEGGEPLSIETGCGITTAEGQQAAWDAYVRFAPHVVILAFPCDPWNKMQNMNVKDPARRDRILAKRELHRPLLHFTEQVCRRQHRKGYYYVVENPSGSAAWQEQPMRDFADYVLRRGHRAHVHPRAVRSLVRRAATQIDSADDQFARGRANLQKMPLQARLPDGGELAAA